MPSGITNRGKFNLLGYAFRNAAEVTNFYIALFLNSAPPTVDTNLRSDLNEIALGNGYTAGGIVLNRDATDFDVLTEDDVNDRALVQLKNIVWTASGGNLPSAGSGARYACLTDDNVTLASREVWTFWDLVSDRTISDTQTLTLIDCEMRLTE
jgi:hypothetical protein